MCVCASVRWTDFSLIYVAREYCRKLNFDPKINYYYNWLQNRLQLHREYGLCLCTHTTHSHSPTDAFDNKPDRDIAYIECIYSSNVKSFDRRVMRCCCLRL